MALVNAKKILLDAKDSKKAVGGFNFTTLEQIKTILKICNENNYPVILQASSSAIKFMGLENIINIVKQETKNLNIDVCLNLDHGKDFEICKKCIDAGFTNVMIDASDKDFDENIKLTKQVVDYAHKFDVTVEAELGALKGVEDEVNVENSHFTDPDQAQIFVNQTNVDSLAISIGTSHGAYKFKGESKLNIDLLQKIKNKISIPLVLHGASMVDENLTNCFNEAGGKLQNAHGVDEKSLLDAIRNGICKVNMDTDFRISFTTGVRECLKDGSIFNLRDYLSLGMKKMEAEVLKRIKILSNHEIG